MNDTRPRFWSKRFRHILSLGLRGDPVGALGGLYWFITRRRVRGWGKLLVAASLAEQAYDRWVRGSEASAFDSYRALHLHQSSVLLCVVIVGDDPVAAARTLESTRAFGPDLRVYFSHGACGGVAALPRDLPAALKTIAHDSESHWVLPLLAGDLLSSAAPEMIARAIGDAGDAALVYWDEDCIDRGRRCDPWIKPDWDPLLFEQLGGLAGASLMSLLPSQTTTTPNTDVPLDRAGLELLQFKLAESSAAIHIPLILTHRSARNRLPTELPKPTSTDAARQLSGQIPKVSVIIPTRDRPDLLVACLRGIAQTSYRGSVETIIVDNGTVDEKALRIIATHEAAGAIVIRDDGPFNFSRLNNSAAAVATGEFLCFFNNDVEPIDPAWLEHMVGRALEDRVGAVGALLLYPSGRIQHAGVAIGLGGAAGHVQKGVRPHEPKFRTWHSVTRQVSAVTAAVMVLRKSHFDAIGGFDETGFPVAFNDVDLCLRLQQSGLRNIFVAEARLLHRESESRGDDRRPERAAKFAAELAALQQRWGTETFLDPHFSPLFLRVTEQCVLIP